MNRDEKRIRETALPPAIVDLGKNRAVFPREPEGGTWIAANDTGISLALLNWHRIDREPNSATVSRGAVIPALVNENSSAEIGDAIAALPLARIRPFRLIAIVPVESNLTEWQWDLETLTRHKHSWQVRHWFSSGFDELKAESVRQQVCDRTVDQEMTDDVDRLRQLHQSHYPERGPFSICMHRNDAATVSYSEVVVQNGQVTMLYRPGPPCTPSAIVAKSL